MPEVVENLISYLQAGEAPLGAVHVGEDVPDDVGDDYIFLAQASETESEALGSRAVDSIGFDAEVVGEDLATQRALTKSLKERIRALPTWSNDFEGIVEFIGIDDHSDDYELKSISDPDDVRHVSAVLITVYL